MNQVKLLSINDFSSHIALLEQSQYVEGTWRWFRTLALTTVEPAESPVFAVAFDDSGSARAVLPLVLGPEGTLRSLTAPYTTRYTPGFPDPYWSRYLGEQAARYVTTAMRLDALDFEDEGVRAFLSGLKQSHLSRATFGNFANWHETIADFDSYWASRPEKLQATVRRKLKSIRKHHDVHFAMASDVSTLNTATRDYLDVYSSSWKQPESHPDFISTLIREVGSEGCVRLVTLSLDGVIAAAQIALIRDRRLTIFKLAHRREFARFSPGTLLTHWMLQSVCSNGKALYVDFGRGNDAYKQDWLRNCRQRNGVLVANWRSGRGIAFLLSQICPTWLANLAKMLPATLL